MYIPQVIRRMSAQEWGGTETVVLNTTRHLRQQGIESEILATRALASSSQETLASVPLKRFDYYYPYLGLSPQGKSQLDRKGGSPLSPSLVRYLKGAQPQLIHGHSMQRMAGMVRQAAQHLKIPYVLSFHGGHFQVPSAEISQMCQPVRRCLHYGRLIDWSLGYQRALSDASGLICVNPAEAEAMRQRYPQQAVLYLPNGVELSTPETLAANGSRFRQTYGIPTDLPLLLCIGRIDPQKGQLAAITYLQSNPAVGLVCIGPVTDPAYAAKLKAAVQTHGLGQRVWLIEGLPPEHPDLADARAAATLAIVPSRHEPFGIVVLEAWRQHLPVVANTVGGLNSLVQQGQNGFKESLNDGFWPRVEHLLREPHQRQQIARSGYETVAAAYTWPAITRQLMRFYETCLHNDTSHTLQRSA